MLFWKMKTLNIQYTTSHDNPQKYDDIWLPIVPADIIPNDVHPSPPPLSSLLTSIGYLEMIGLFRFFMSS